MSKLDFATLLMATIEKNASDLHLTVGNPPMLRVHGSIQPINTAEKPLTQEVLHGSLYDVLTEDQRKRLERDKELDFALELKKVGRFRVNVYLQRGTVATVIRQIRLKIPDFEELRLPSFLGDLVLDPRGLILVTGATGTGKSTTMAAMIDYRASQLDGPGISFAGPHAAFIQSESHPQPETHSQ